MISTLSLKRWLGKRAAMARNTTPPRRSRLVLEMLERRDVPAIYVVTTTADGAGTFQGGAGTNSDPFRWTTLRGALDDVNTNHATEANTIRLASNTTYTVTEGQLTANLAAGGSLTIKPTGKGLATIEAVQPDSSTFFRVIEFEADTTAKLHKIRITGGLVNVDADGPGGGILNHGNLTLSRSVVNFNQAFDSESKFAFGGGIANDGALSLKRTRVTQNAVTNANVNDLDPLQFGIGGGIGNAGELTLSKSSRVDENGVLSKFAAGGGIGQAPINGREITTLSLSRSVVSNNVALGIEADDPVNSQSKFSSMALGGGIFDLGNAEVSIDTSTISDNRAQGGDTDTDAFIMAGVALGGGLHSGLFGYGGLGPSDLHIYRSTFSNNRAIGGASTVTNGGFASGGGLMLAQAHMWMANSTISGNLAQGGSGKSPGPFSALGGGLAIVNSEIGPEAAQVEEGVRLINVTVTENTALAGDEPGAGGGIFSEGAPPEIWNTIIAQNFIDLSRDESLSGSDVVGTFLSTGAGSGHNLIGNIDGSTGFGGPGSGDKVGTGADVLNARLRPLADNGGPTQTHLPRSDSPAIDGGDDAVLTFLDIDQIGNPRKFGKHVDIGSVEIGSGDVLGRRWNR